VRFERLFADLEAEFEAASEAAATAEVAERIREQRARIAFVDRLRASVGTHVRLRVTGGASAVEGALRVVGADWLIVRAAADRDALVRCAALLEVVGSIEPGASPVPSVTSRTPITVLLGRLAMDRATVMIDLVDGSTLTGTIDSVGADAIDMLDVRADEPAEWQPVRGSAGPARVRVVPIAAVAVVRER
jgi:hypothetical protein